MSSQWNTRFFFISTMIEWPLPKIEITSYSLLTGHTARDVHVLLPREYHLKSSPWRLLTSAYILCRFFSCNSS